MSARNCGGITVNNRARLPIVRRAFLTTIILITAICIAQVGNQDGSGIGLIVRKELIEQMGGTIEFNSESEQSCEIWVDLPFAQGHAALPSKIIPTP